MSCGSRSWLLAEDFRMVEVVDDETHIVVPAVPVSVREIRIFPEDSIPAAAVTAVHCVRHVFGRTPRMTIIRVSVQQIALSGGNVAVG